MALRLSTGLVNKLMDAGSFKSIFENTADGCYINVYSGTQPASADDVPSGTLLVTVSVGGAVTGMTFEASAGSPTAGQLEKASGETWSGTASNTGTAGWFRLYRKADSPSSSSTSLSRVDGAVSTSGAQMNLSTLSVASGAPFVISTCSFTLPQS